MFAKQVKRRAGDSDPFRGLAMGDLARETLSGFSGVVSGRVEHIAGCNQVLLQPEVGADGAWRDSIWFDVERVEVIERGYSAIEGRPTGGEIPTPPTRTAAAETKPGPVLRDRLYAFYGELYRFEAARARLDRAVERRELADLSGSEAQDFGRALEGVMGALVLLEEKDALPLVTTEGVEREKGRVAAEAQVIAAGRRTASKGGDA